MMEEPMMKRLPLVLAIVLFLAACSGVSETEYMAVPKEVERITVKGNGVSIEKDGRIIENEVILEESGEMDVFFKSAGEFLCA
jgi:PBP1b-binding outer membrane lipoprotein LpoB